MTAPTTHELSERLARLEERMMTQQAEYKTDIALLAKDAAEREARQERESRNSQRWLVGFMVAVAVAIAALVKYLP